MAEDMAYDVAEGQEIAVEIDGLIVEKFIAPKSARLTFTPSEMTTLFVHKQEGVRLARNAPRCVPSISELFADYVPGGEEVAATIRCGDGRAKLTIGPKR